MAERFGCGVDLPVVGEGRREAGSNKDDESSGESTESSNDTALSAVIVLRFMLILFMLKGFCDMCL